MTFEEWWEKNFPNVNISWYESSSDALTKEWFNIVKQAFEDGKSTHHCGNCLGIQPESCMFARTGTSGWRGGGGRMDTEDLWFYLREEKLE